MSSTQTRLPRAQAAELAWELVALLSPYCERIEILGSIRRQRETIGDIELLAIPETDQQVQTDLFGQQVAPPLDLLNIHVDELQHEIGLGKRLDDRGRQRWGQRFKAAVYKGFAVDLFVCKPPAQYGVLKVIRTGSAEFSHRLVTPVEQGGWCPAGFYFKDGQLWIIQGSGVHVALHTPEETQVFAAIQRPCVAPEDREVP